MQSGELRKAASSTAYKNRTLTSYAYQNLLIYYIKNRYLQLAQLCMGKSL